MASVTRMRAIGLVGGIALAVTAPVFTGSASAHHTREECRHSVLDERYPTEVCPFLTIGASVYRPGATISVTAYGLTHPHTYLASLSSDPDPGGAITIGDEPSNVINQFNLITDDRHPHTYTLNFTAPAAPGAYVITITSTSPKLDIVGWVKFTVSADGKVGIELVHNTGGPSGNVGADGKLVALESAAAAPSAAVAGDSGSATLPATGNDAGTTVRLAAALIAVGGGMMALTFRRRRALA